MMIILMIEALGTTIGQVMFVMVGKPVMMVNIIS